MGATVTVLEAMAVPVVVLVGSLQVQVTQVETGQRDKEMEEDRVCFPRAVPPVARVEVREVLAITVPFARGRCPVGPEQSIRSQVRR